MKTGLFDLGGKVAIVTGGNGGIGLGMALGLAEAGVYRRGGEIPKRTKRQSLSYRRRERSRLWSSTSRARNRATRW